MSSIESAMSSTEFSSTAGSSNEISSTGWKVSFSVSKFSAKLSVSGKISETFGTYSSSGRSSALSDSSRTASSKTGSSVFSFSKELKESKESEEIDIELSSEAGVSIAGSSITGAFEISSVPSSDFLSSSVVESALIRMLFSSSPESEIFSSSSTSEKNPLVSSCCSEDDFPDLNLLKSSFNELISFCKEESSF